MNPYKKLAYSRRVVANLLSGRAFRGILVERRGSLLHLKQAELLEPGSAPVAVSGSVLLELAQIDFIQVVTE